MDTGALANASAKISSVKQLRFTRWLICVQCKNSRSPSVCLSLWRDRIPKERRMRVDTMPKKKKRERMLAVFQNTVILVDSPQRKALISKLKEKRGVSGEAKYSSLANTRPAIQKEEEINVLLSTATCTIPQHREQNIFSGQLEERKMKSCCSFRANVAHHASCQSLKWSNFLTAH